MDLHLDLDPALPRRVAVEGAVRAAIRTGRLRASDPLPSTRALAAQLGIARGTVVQAYAQLAAEGWLITRQGAPARVVRDGGGEPSPAASPGPYLAEVPARWDLRPGLPDASLFPGRAWVTAVRAATRSDADVYGYGDPRGRPELRRVLADYLSRARGVVTDPAQILVTSGFTNGLALAAEALSDLGLRHVAMEDPCLDVHRRVIAQAGLTIHPVPVDANGLDVTALAATPARAVLVAPAHQFPMGATLNPVRRGKLLEWARRVDGYVIEDDYDGEYRFDRKPVSALQALDPARVVYGGTTSKVLSPAMRLGWLALPPRLCRPVFDRLQSEQAPALDQLALAQLIRDGHFDRQVRRTRSEYGRRRDHLVAAGLPLTGIAAGLHAVLPLQDEEALITRARQQSLALLGLGPFWHGPPRAQGVIVGYSRLPQSTVYMALDQLIALAGDSRPGGTGR
ncbi:MocR-like pyridoxine biosynthesis transcription factor PdxR [Streptomyces cavernicola]|uniref:PLP-dependent aminotransferase family protein n=1 Tax=Streptomyces cavernicola TaxID=3043613 RepID=A0ABT6S6Z6_9ACTN|nr:PLP-dependent aminotransferase family protein [Streptomyces sp. B-S-A6]MDI3403208.1 PLP-dependent aminotransferase family protein [Streptomyces sp. B-S-A6]